MDIFDLSAIIRLDSSQYEAGLADAEKKSGGFGNAVKNGIGTAMKIGAAGFAAAGAAATAFAATSVKTGAEFDKSMSQVAATMGYSVDEINTEGSEAQKTFSALRDFAMEMGASTAFSATQASDALNYMALAGYDAETSMKMLPNVLNLAAAGGMELATASDMITDSQSALGLSLEETSDLVDMMAKASSKSNTSVSQLGEAILTVGGTAKNLSGGTQELATVLGILADNGTKGAEGGTALRNILLSLGAPTDKAAKRLQKLGVNAYDADGNMRPLQDTFADLNEAMADMTDAEKNEIINDIFNKADLKNVNALLATSSDRWEELSTAIGNSAGSAEQMANTQLDNLAGDMTLFQSALEGAQILVSDALTPSLRGLVQFGTDAITRLSEGFAEGGLAGAMSALGDLLSEGLQNAIDKFPDFVDAGYGLLKSVASGIMDHLPRLVLSGMSIVANLLLGILKGAPGIITQVGATVSGLIQKIADGLPDFLTKGKEILDNLIAGITENAPLVLTAIGTAITDIVTTFADNLPLFLQKGKEILASVVSGIAEIAPGVVAFLGLKFDEFITAIGNKLPEFLNKGVELIVEVVKGISNMMPAVLAFIAGTMVRIILAIAEKLPDFLQQGVEIAAKLASGLLDNVPTILLAVGSALAQLLAGIAGALPEFLKKGIQLLGSIATGIINAVPALIAQIPGILTDLAGKFLEYDWLSLGGNIIGGIVDGVVAAAGSLVTAVGDAVSGALGFAKGLLGIKSPSRVFRDQVGKMITEGMAIGINQGTPEVVNAVGDLNDDALDAIDDIGYDADVSIKKVGSGKDTDSNSKVADALERVNSTLEWIDQTISDRIAEAIGDISLELNGREFGRLVNNVRTN